MAYSDFTLLNPTLQETVELAIAINLKKARSEMMITSVLLEVRRRAKGQELILRCEL